VALLLGSLLAVFAGTGLVSAQPPIANPVRTLPAVVMPGQEFQVTITFTSTFDGFWNIGLEDWAPAGWNVSVDHVNWCTPPADWSTPVLPWTTNKAEYFWLGLPPGPPPYAYPAGTSFTAMYWVRVPSDALPGTYTFSPLSLIRYYDWDDLSFPPVVYEQPIEGDPIDVAPYTVGYDTYPVNKLRVLAPWIALLAVIMFGTSLLVVMRRRVQT
jgi:hypothetical protein